MKINLPFRKKPNKIIIQVKKLTFKKIFKIKISFLI